jgi:hypothetical protein
VDRPAELAYWIGAEPLRRVVKAGIARERPA